MLAQPLEVLVGDGVGHRRGMDREVERGPLGFAEEVAGLVLPDGLQPGLLGPGAPRALERMGLAVAAAVGEAGDVRDEVLQLRRHGARGGIQHRPPQGDEALHDLRPASHDAQPVGHEAERALVRTLHLFEPLDLVEREWFESGHGSPPVVDRVAQR